MKQLRSKRYNQVLKKWINELPSAMRDVLETRVAHIEEILEIKIAVH